MMRVAAALTCFGLLACGAPAPDATPPPERPNIVLIIADDLGYGDYGFMGSPVAQTPNIDALAAGGSTFPVTYNTASVCRPSLASLLTGLDPLQWDATATEYARRHPGPRGKRPVRDFPTLPRLLGQHGYATYQAGKMWEDTFALAGFSEGLKTDRVVGLHDVEGWAGGEASLEIGRTTLAPVTDFIDAHADESFFVWFAPMLPHLPHDASQRYVDLYSDADLSTHERMYYANVSRLDAAVGAVIAHLEGSGLRERTLVVFLADNGWETEQRDEGEVWTGGVRGKASMFELGWRTPLIFNWPGVIQAGAVYPSLVSTLDLFPTLLGYAGVPVPPQRDGQDLQPVLAGGDATLRSTLYGSALLSRRRGNAPPHAAAAPRARAFFARTDRWHYIWDREADSDLLYDIVEDPAEQRDVSGFHPDAVERFRAEIDAWYAGVQVPRLPEPDADSPRNAPQATLAE